ncbi:hypothetical protein ONE63_010639 [Megalurothrips usitatus]|uniref:Uncharacterized protein n=1 Tax=Megalurothrips usitatus TaxID=439358 RepID=A0AAV7XKX5_9NEOP|nr:hypothetical protein ONE63_010639 [Megalurothrips usitatus]
MYAPALLVSAITAALLCADHMASAQVYIMENPATNDSSSSSTPPTPAETTEADVEASTLSQAEQDDCHEQIGKVENGVPVNKMRKYDVAKILEEHGGAPGKLNATWNRDVPEFPVPEPKAEPLPDTTNTTFWVYDYRRTDFRSFIRLEHGLLRQKGTKDEYVDVRGELYWTPPDFCGRARHTKYRVDPNKGLVSDVTLEYCTINSETLWCAPPANCMSNETYMACVASPSSALMASLVG